LALQDDWALEIVVPHGLARFEASLTMGLKRLICNKRAGLSS
jgi:hypothetical protein